MRRTCTILLLIGTFALSGQSAAIAGTAPPPVPQPFTDCHSFCTSPALLRSATPTVYMFLPASSPDRAHINYDLRSSLWDPIAAGSVLASPGGVAGWQVPEGLLQTGRTYWVRARSLFESRKRSDWTKWIRFTVDLGRPQSPSVRSEQYPEGEWGAVLGTPGTFELSTPALDVAAFAWHLMTGPTAVVSATGPGPRTASVTTTPPRDLGDTFHAQAIDAAGNVSDVYSYHFKVSPLPDAHAHWAFDETEGRLAADSGNLGLPGSLSGAAAFAPGYVDGGNAVRLGGGVVATSMPVLDLSRSFTVMAWVNLDDLAAGRQTVVSQGDLTLAFDPAGAWCATLVSTMVCGDGSVAGPPVAGQWTHVAVRYDSITGEFAVYVMGHPESCGGEQNAATFSGAPTNSDSLLIGQSAAGASWHGLIDDVYAYRRALAGSEICMHALK